MRALCLNAYVAFCLLVGHYGVMGKWTDIATWRGSKGVYQGGSMLEHRGLVIHIADGYYEGTIAWMSSPSNGSSSSAHFVVSNGAKGQGKDGDIAQMIDTDTTAFTQKAGNGHWLSVECAGFGGDNLTEAQMRSIARLLYRAHLVYGIPLQQATSASGRGLGHHSMGGTAWGHQSCPGSPIIAQKGTILRYAQELKSSGGNMALTSDEINQIAKAVAAFRPGVLKEGREIDFNKWISRYDPETGVITMPPGEDASRGTLDAFAEWYAWMAAFQAAIALQRLKTITEQLEQLAARVDQLAAGTLPAGTVDTSRLVAKTVTVEVELGAE